MRVKTLLAAIALAAAGAPQAQTELKFQAMPLGSIWYVFAASFTKYIQPQLPAGAEGRRRRARRRDRQRDPGEREEGRPRLRERLHVGVGDAGRAGDLQGQEVSRHPRAARRAERGVDRRHADRGLHQAHRQRHDREGARLGAAAAGHHEARGQHGAAGGADGVRGRRPRLRQVQGEGRADHPGRRRPDPADDARRPRRPLLRERFTRPPGDAGGLADRAGALPRPAGEVARRCSGRTA